VVAATMPAPMRVEMIRRERMWATFMFGDELEENERFFHNKCIEE
jgi:hypothetical protein